jgi:predicted homoserine dehydrogenase-like protein
MLAGGVFVVVETPDPATGRFLAGKGIPASSDGRHLLLHNPVHLLGAEAPALVLAAARERRSTGGEDVRLHVDLVARARRDLEAGEVLAMGARHAIAAIEPLVQPAQPLDEAAAVPYYLAAGRTLARPVRRGAVLTMADVRIDADSTLYRLRREQDEAFAQ